MLFESYKPCAGDTVLHILQMKNRGSARWDCLPSHLSHIQPDFSLEKWNIKIRLFKLDFIASRCIQTTEVLRENQVGNRSMWVINKLHELLNDDVKGKIQACVCVGVHGLCGHIYMSIHIYISNVSDTTLKIKPIFI